jgi:hypothetical protein
MERQWTITASIGRNIGRVPMEEAQWDAFRDIVDQALRDHEVTVFFAGEGTGEYEGVREAAATWVGSTVRRPDVALESELGSIAGLFGQASIAVTYGETILAGPLGIVEV